MFVIDKIFWKRTYLFIEFNTVKVKEICLKNSESGRIVPFEIKKLSENRYRGKLNITIANGRELLEEGIWRISDGDGNAITEYAACFNDNKYLGQRVFRYTRRFYSYAFRLECSKDGISIINGHYMSVKKKKNEELFRKTFFDFEEDGVK